MTDQRPVSPAPAPLEAYAQQFDGLFAKLNQRNSFRRYLEGLLLPTERHQSLRGLANTEPVVGAQHRQAQASQWFLSESTWSERAVQERRLQLLLSDPLTAPTAEGVLAIDEHGDRKDGDHTAHVGRQDLSNLGKIDNGVVSVTSLWADERVSYPVGCEPSPRPTILPRGSAIRPSVPSSSWLWSWCGARFKPGSLFGRWWLTPSMARITACGRGGATSRSATCWPSSPPMTGGTRSAASAAGSEAAHAARGRDVKHPGAWVKLVRTFRDGLQAAWWGLEVVAGPSGSHKQHRVVIATTDPVTLPKPSTMDLITNLPHPAHAEGHWSGLAPARLEEVVWLYGLRLWVEQSYKQVKHVLGWSEYQLRADRAIRRHWQLACCAFAFCWHHQHDLAPRPSTSQAPEPPRLAARLQKKKSAELAERPQVCWPAALRAVRGWLEPWILLRRFWRAWSQAPPPLPLQQLLDGLWQGNRLFLYEPP